MRAKSYVVALTGALIALTALSIWNADMRIPHRVAGGIYFSVNALIMLIGIYLTWQHPELPRWIGIFCLLAATSSLYFLYSSGKASWSEWACVVLNFAVAMVMGWHGKRVLTAEE